VSHFYVTMRTQRPITNDLRGFFVDKFEGSVRVIIILLWIYCYLLKNCFRRKPKSNSNKEDQSTRNKYAIYFAIMKLRTIVQLQTTFLAISKPLFAPLPFFAYRSQFCSPRWQTTHCYVMTALQYVSPSKSRPSHLLLSFTVVDPCPRPLPRYLHHSHPNPRWWQR